MRPASHYPNAFRKGVTIQQLPVVNSINPDNRVLWVDSNSVKHGYGTYQDPFATILDAIGKASAGDTILIAAAHAEALTATSFVCSKALTIIGLGSGTRIPTFTTAIAGGVLSITASNVVVSNIRLVCNYTGGSTQAVLIATGLSGVVLDKIQTRDTSATKEWLIDVSFAGTATDCVVQNCQFVGLTGGSRTNSILEAGILTNCAFINNYIYVDSSDDVLDFLTSVHVGLYVAGNTVYNMDTDAAGYCIRLKSDATGIIEHNICAYNKNDAEIFVGAAAWWFENYASNTVGESGKLDPANSASIP